MATAIGYELTQRLTLAGQIRTADPARVRRLLDGLGFAAQQPTDNTIVCCRSVAPGCCWKVTGCAALVRSLYVFVWSINMDEPVWQWQSELPSDDSLQVTLERLSAALGSELRRSLSSCQGGSGSPGRHRKHCPVWERCCWRLQLAVSAPENTPAERSDTAAWLVGSAGAQRPNGLGAATGSAAPRPSDNGQIAAERTGPWPSLSPVTQKLPKPSCGKSSPRRHLVCHRFRLLAAARQTRERFDEAIETLAGLLREDPGNGRAWFESGKYLLLAGDAKRAVDEYLVRAQVLANRLDDPWLRADVSNGFGVGYRRLGQMDVAAEESLRAVHLRESLGDARGQSASLGNLSLVYSIQGNFVAAREALDQARALLVPLGDTAALANLASDYGLLAEEQGDFATALDSFREGLGLRQELGDAHGIAESLLSVGFAYYQLGQFDNARTYWQQARSQYIELEDQAGLVHSREALGLAGIARGDWISAREELAAGLMAAEALQMDEQANGAAILADLDRLEGNYADALERVDKGTFGVS
ncbi:MAG: tetratricopeptide repeat protein [Lysobacterales bacterium]